MVLQFLLAGIGLFVPGADFAAHRLVGASWLPVLALFVFVGAAIGGRSRWDVTAGLALLVVVLTTGALPSRAESDPGLPRCIPCSLLHSFASDPRWSCELEQSRGPPDNWRTTAACQSCRRCLV